MPNPATFPYESMQLKLKTGETIEVDAAHFEKCLSYDLTVSVMTDLIFPRVHPPSDLSYRVDSLP